jgi:hypothetical protein
MSAPTIFGREPDERGGELVWRLGPWQLTLNADGLAAIALESFRGRQIVYIEPRSSAAELESWLRGMLTETCGALGIELQERDDRANRVRGACNAAMKVLAREIDPPTRAGEAA